jgi:uncharacterized protein (DUF362 family)
MDNRSATSRSVLTRRAFLARLVGMAAGVAVLGPGCASAGHILNQGSGQRRPSTDPTGDQAYLSLVRGTDPAAITERAVAALGGIERFVLSGDNVVIKPNICVDYNPPEYAATTNPAVVATLVKLCLGAGAKGVTVMDMPFGGTPESAYQVSGIADAVKDAGGRMVIMNRAKFVKTDIPDGRSIQSWPIYGDILTADVVINVPIAKHHSLARLSLGLKNLLGVVESPNQIHSDLGRRIADLASIIRPTLTVVDAYRILMDHGPTGGSLNDVKQMNTIIATHDPVAADTRAAQMFGLGSNDVPFIEAAEQMGLGQTDLSGVRVEELSL